MTIHRLCKTNPNLVENIATEQSEDQNDSQDSNYKKTPTHKVNVRGVRNAEVDEFYAKGTNKQEHMRKFRN